MRQLLTIEKNKVLAILLSPLIGGSSFLSLFFLNKFLDLFWPKQMDGPLTADAIFYIYVFPILFLLAYIFQIIVLEPIFSIFKKKNRLSKHLIINIGILLIFGFSIFISIFFGTIQFGLKDYLIAFALGLVICSSYFIPCLTSYYLIYVRQLSNQTKT